MFPADQELPVSRLQFFPTSFTIAQAVHARRFELMVLLAAEGGAVVSLSGFRAVPARSGSAHITVFKSNLIQAGELQSPGVWLLWVGLSGSLLGCEDAGKAESGGLKSPINQRASGNPQHCAVPISALRVTAWLQKHQTLHTGAKRNERLSCPSVGAWVNK